MNAIQVKLPIDRRGDGSQDITQTLLNIESLLRRHELLLSGLSPTISVVTQNTNWTPTDRVVLLDTSAGNLTYTLPAPVEAIAQGFLYLTAKWISSANTATIDTLDTSLIDGSPTFVFGAQYDEVSFVPSLIAGYWGWWIVSR